MRVCTSAQWLLLAPSCNSMILSGHSLSGALETRCVPQSSYTSHALKLSLSAPLALLVTRDLEYSCNDVAVPWAFIPISAYREEISVGHSMGSNSSLRSRGCADCCAHTGQSTTAQISRLPLLVAYSSAIMPPFCATLCQDTSGRFCTCLLLPNSVCPVTHEQFLGTLMRQQVHKHSSM